MQKINTAKLLAVFFNAFLIRKKSLYGKIKKK